MDIEDVEKMWAADSEIDETNLIRESSKIPLLHAKYYKIYYRASLRATKLRYELRELERAKTEYYNGTMAPEDLKERGWKPNPLKILRQDINRYIESDKDIVELSLKIEYQSSLAKFLEDIIKQINNRNFIIRNMVDLLKFQQGGY